MSQNASVRQVAAHLAKLENLLSEDTKVALGLLAPYKTDYDDNLFFFTKIFLLAFHSHVDSVSYYLRSTQSILAEDMGSPLSNRRLALLLECDYNPDNDSVSKERRYNPFLKNVRLGFNGFSEVVGLPFKLNESHPSWEAFKNLVRIRNGVVHPSNFADLFPVKSINVIPPAVEWFLIEYLRFFNILHDHADASNSQQQHTERSYHRSYDRALDGDFGEVVSDHQRRAGASIEAICNFLDGYMRALEADLYKAEFLYALGTTAPDSPVVLDPGSQFAERTLLRMLFVVAEGLASVMRWAAKTAAEQCSFVISDPRLLEGSPAEPDSLRRAFTAFFGKLGASSFDLPFGRLRTYRNRIMHPKSEQDFQLTTREGAEIQGGVHRLANMFSFLPTVVDCKRRTG